MAGAIRTDRKANEIVDRAVAGSRIPPQRLLDVVEKWRRMQAGSSHQKCKGHSSSS
jgi:hypothetical protein